MSERADAADGVAENAGGGEKDLTSALARRVRGLGGRAALRDKPRLECIPLFGDQKKSHVRVLIAAEFCTSSLEHSRPFGSKKMTSRPSGEQILLAGEIWDPEAVDHIGGRQLEKNRTAHRNVDLVGGDYRVRGRIRGINHLPPPLMADDLDPQRLGTNRGRYSTACDDACRQYTQKG